MISNHLRPWRVIASTLCLMIGVSVGGVYAQTDAFGTVSGIEQIGRINRYASRIFWTRVPPVARPRGSRPAVAAVSAPHASSGRVAAPHEATAGSPVTRARGRHTEPMPGARRHPPLPHPTVRPGRRLRQPTTVHRAPVRRVRRAMSASPVGASSSPPHVWTRVSTKGKSPL